MSDALDIKDKMRKKGYATADEVAHLIGRSVPTVHQLGHTEKIKCVRIGDGPRALAFYEWSSVLEYLGPEAAKLLDLPSKLAKE